MVKSKVAKIKRMVMELYDIPVDSEPMIETVAPTIHVLNIWEILNPVDTPVKKTKMSKEKEREIGKKEIWKEG